MAIDEPEPSMDWLSDNPYGRVAWRRIAVFRVVACVVFSTLVVLTPVVDSSRWPALVVVGGVAMVVNLVLLVHLRRGGRFGPASALSDALLPVAFAALVPAAYGPVAILVLGVSSKFSFWISRRMTAMTMACAAALMLAVGLYHRPSGWAVTLVVFVAASFILVVTTSSAAEAMAKAGQRYDGIVNGISAVIWEASGLDSDPEYLSSQVEDVLGLTMEECRVEGFLRSRVHPDDLQTYDRARAEVATGHDQELGYRILDGSGKVRYLHERVAVSAVRNGRRSCCGVVVNETARNVAEVSARSYDDFIAGVPMAMAILRLDDLDDPQSLRVVTANPAAKALLVNRVDNPIGMLLADVMPGIPKFMAQLADVVALNTSLEAPFIEIPTSDAVFSIRAIPLPDQCVGMALDDVTKAARTAETLKHQAMHDHLTGLPNRAQFNERLEDSIRATGPGDGSTVAVMMVDLNRFKAVNDSLGHEYGDRLLMDLSKRLARNIRGCDTIARIGGDEFAILVRSPDVEAMTLDIAQRIEQVVAEPFNLGGNTVSVGCSIGIAIRSRSLLAARTLVRDADHAMYRAKSAGGGIVVHDGGPTPRGTPVGPPVGREVSPARNAAIGRGSPRARL